MTRIEGWTEIESPLAKVTAQEIHGNIGRHPYVLRGVKMENLTWDSPEIGCGCYLSDKVLMLAEISLPNGANCNYVQDKDKRPVTRQEVLMKFMSGLTSYLEETRVTRNKVTDLLMLSVGNHIIDYVNVGTYGDDYTYSESVRDENPGIDLRAGVSLAIFERSLSGAWVTCVGGNTYGLREVKGSKLYTFAKNISPYPLNPEVRNEANLPTITSQWISDRFRRENNLQIWLATGDLAERGVWMDDDTLPIDVWCIPNAEKASRKVTISSGSALTASVGLGT